MRYRALLFLILLYQNLKVFFPWSLTYMNSITVFSYLISERRQIRKAFLSSNNRMKLSLNNVPKPSLLAAVLRITNQLIYKDRLKDCCIVHILPAKWQLKFCLFCPFQGPVFKDDYTLIYFGGDSFYIHNYSWEYMAKDGHGCSPFCKQSTGLRGSGVEYPVCCIARLTTKLEKK